MYINFEGVDGTGKSTVMEFVAEKLRKSEILQKLGIKNIIMTKEPKGFFRDIILDADNKYNLTETARMFLFQADRALHSENLIEPNRDRDDTIILGDRGPYSTLTYQSVLLGADYFGQDLLKDLKTCTNIALNDVWPDYIFLFNCEDINILKSRLSKLDQDYFDQKDEGFFEEIQDAYTEIIFSSEHSKKTYTIDASREIDFTVEIVYNRIVNLILDKGEQQHDGTN